MDPSPPPGRQPEPIRLSPIGGSERRAGPALLALLLLLAVAVIKPWAGPGSGQPGGPTPIPPAALVGTSGPASGAPAADAASPATLMAPTLPDPVDATRCLAPQGWRLVTYEVSPQRVVRSWIVVAPVPATGPLDPSIVPLPLVSDDLLGVGLCAPGVGPGAAAWDLVAPRLAGLWRLGGGTGTTPTASLEPRPLDPQAPPASPAASAADLPRSTPCPSCPSGPSFPPDIYDGVLSSLVAGRFAFLYAAPPPASRSGGAALPAGGATWPAGRYVAVVVEPGTGAALWFGFALTSPAARGPSASSPRP